MLSFEPLPMKEAQVFWRDKVKLSQGQFSRLSDEAKLRAFAVSGIAKGAELDTVFNALQQSIDAGISYGQFKKQAGAVFARRGWTGERAWRVDNIFRTNIQTAYNVGRYRQMQRVAKRRPYWMYDAVNDSRTRPTHRAVNGKVFPFDHPFWDSWYPPNGFRCRCGVRSLSKREIERRGLTVEDVDPTGHLIEPRTPDGAKMPARLLMPDPGFKHHPGKVMWGGVVDQGGKAAVWKDMGNLKSPADYRRRKLANVVPADIADMDETMLLASGKSDDYYLAELEKRVGAEKLITDATGEPVILSRRSFLIDKARDDLFKFSKAGHGESIGLIEKMLTEPFEVWLVPQANKQGRVRLTRRYISLWKTQDKQRIGGLAVMEVSDGVWQGVTHFLPRRRSGWDLRYVENQRRGILLWGKSKGRPGSQTGTPMPGRRGGPP